MRECTICNKQKTDIRSGMCFSCAQAESIIYDGTDMYDKDINGKEKGQIDYTALDKLKFLISEGWVNPKG